MLKNDQKMSVLLVAGEKSGEEHAMSFVPHLQEKLPQIEFWGVGGDVLSAQGMDLEYHLKDFSSWGISEVISKIPFYLNALNVIEKKVIEKNCKVAILIDFQDFNLKLAQRLKKRGVDTLYYVAPQAWAWKAWRAKVLEDCVHTLFTIIKFEKKWFENHGVSKVVSISHPLWNHYHKKILKIRDSHLSVSSKPFENFKKEVNILILPGSRNSEVKYLLPTFMKAAKRVQGHFSINIGIVKSPSVNAHYYGPYEKEFSKIWDSDQLSDALIWANFSIATSGTVTLACAIFEVPTVVSFDSSLFNNWIFYTFVNYNRFFSLANIVHQSEVFPELLSEKCSDYTIEKKLLEWLKNKKNYESIKRKISKTLSLIDESGVDVTEVMKKAIVERYV